MKMRGAQQSRIYCFSIIIYSYSHRLKTDHKFHSATSVKIRLPAIDQHAQSMFIIFDERTIHCGSESTMIDSTTTAGDLRLFIHFQKNRNQESSRNRQPYAHNKVDKKSCCECNQSTYDERNPLQTCSLCENYLKNNLKYNETCFELDVEKYILLKHSNKPRHF